MSIRRAAQRWLIAHSGHVLSMPPQAFRTAIHTGPPAEERMMNRKVICIAAGLMGLAAWGIAQDQPGQPQRGDPGTQGIEVLTRGPVHEAFAEPTDPQPRPQPAAPR